MSDNSETQHNNSSQVESHRSWYRQFENLSSKGQLLQLSLLSLTILAMSSCYFNKKDQNNNTRLSNEVTMQASLEEEGKKIFRYDTFGDETLWTDKLKMHEIISTSIDPKTALSVGLKVDSEALPPEMIKGIQEEITKTIELFSNGTTRTQQN